MLKLILKDFVIQKKSLLSLILIALVFISVFSVLGMSQMMFAIAVFPMVYGFINRSFYEDEKNHSLRLLTSLPLKRDVLVSARYVSVGVVLIVSSLFFAIVNNSLKKFGVLPEDEIVGSLIFTCSTLFVFVILISIYMPLAYKLGYIKAAGINRFLMLGLFGAISASSLLSKNVLKESPPEFIEDVVGFVESLNPASIAVIILLLSLFIYYVSYEVSIHLFRKRVLF